MIKIKLNQSVIDDFYSSIQQLFKNSFSKKINKKQIWKINICNIEKILSNKLNDFDENINFEKLIKADYSYLKSLVEFIDANPKRYELSKREKDYFLAMYERFKKADFIKQLDVHVCPYCNRNYIFNFNKNNNQNATAQLDHFFDKKKYPYLAVSLYNLVPSCSTCNQRKSSIRKDIFHPYSESFNDSAKFRYVGIDKENIEDYFFNTSRIKLSIEVIKDEDEDEEKVKNHKEVFNLENLYSEHKDIVSELLVKREIYSDSYIDELLQNYEGTIFKNREDLLRLITCGYVEDKDLDKRPLSKLIKDISEELELL